MGARKVSSTSAKTYNRLSAEAADRVNRMTASFNKSGTYQESVNLHSTISSQINSVPEKVSRLKTGSNGAGNVTNVTSTVNIVAGSIAHTLKESGDLGGAVIAMPITATQTAIYGTKTAIKTGKGIYKAASGTYQVGLTGARGVVTLAKTATMVVNGKAVSRGGVINTLKMNASESGLAQTVLSKKVIHSVEKIRTTVQGGPKTVAKGVGRGFLRGAKGLGKAAAKKGIPGVGGAMMRSGDETISGYGKIMTSTRAGVQTGVRGVKVTKRAVRTGVRATRAVARGTRVAVRATVTAGRSVVSAAISAVGGALAGTPVGWIAISAALIVAVIIILFVVLGSGGAAVSGNFTETDDETGTEEYYEAEDYLMEVIPGISEDFKQDLLKTIEKCEKEYDVVRLYTNSGSSDVVEPTMEGIDAIMPSDTEIANTLTAMYSAIVYTYDFELSKRQAKSLAKELFEDMFVYDKDPAVTYEICGQDLATGEDDPVEKCTACSEAAGEPVYHALDDCPNYTTVVHTIYTCAECDEETTTAGSNGKLTCGKTEHTHSTAEGCYEWKLSGGSFERVLVCTKTEHTHSPWVSEANPGCYGTSGTTGVTCSGCNHCDGHSVASITLSDIGVYTVAYDYFQSEIDELSAIAEEDRTEEDTDKLLTYIEAYDIFDALVEDYVDGYSGSFSIDDLGDVDWAVSADRKGNQDVVDFALTQVGQKGGKPYWSYYGFSSRVSWCACFVHYCMEHTSASSAWPKTSNNAYCQTVANYFQSHGQWGSGTYTNLVPGDVIYFDWDGDGHTDHTGIVVGTDGNLVYTVEGNSGDAVKCKTYPIGSGVIYGYGLMNYN